VLPVLRLIGPFVEEYIARREKSKLSASHKKLMGRCLRGFAALFPSMEVVHFKGLHIQAWLDGLVAGGELSGGSLKNQMSVLSALFGHAVKLGVIAVNPCAGVDLPEMEPAVLKLPIADEDFEKLKGFVSGDWLTAIMFMRFSGLRLVDSVSIDASQLSFVDGACLLNVTPGKTDKPEVLPLFEPLVGHLKGFCLVPGALCPSLCFLSSSCLSKQFVKLCDKAGVTAEMVTLPNGREHRRVTAHSLKHAFVTGLARLGIPEALRMKLAAHVSESAHRGYNHEDGMDLHRQVAGFFK
jgi:integrase